MIIRVTDRARGESRDHAPGCSGFDDLLNRVLRCEGKAQTLANRSDLVHRLIIRREVILTTGFRYEAIDPAELPLKVVEKAAEYMAAELLDALPADVARERANNLATALAYEEPGTDPVPTTTSVLSRVLEDHPLDVRTRVIARVALAWTRATSAAFLALAVAS